MAARRNRDSSQSRSTEVRIEPWHREASGEVVALMNRLRAETGQEPTTVEEFVDQIGHPDWDPANRLLLARADGQIVGFVDVWVGVFETGTRATLRFGVAPERRGQGIATWLIAAVLPRIPEQCEYLDAPTSPEALELRWFLSGLGFEHSHSGYLMSGPARGMAPALPAGLRLQPLLPERDKEAFRALHNAAFAGTPRWRPITREALDYYLSRSYFDPAGVRILVDERTERWLGFVWADVDTAEWRGRGERVGYIESLGVLPEVRQRGLGRLLLRAGQAWLASQGCERAELSVNATNERALALYRKEGFEVRQETEWVTAPMARTVRCVERKRAMPADRRYFHAQAAVGRWYREYLSERTSQGLALPPPPIGVFRDWLIHLGEEEASVVLARSGMTLVDFMILRRTQASHGSLLRTLSEATRPVPRARLARFSRRYLTKHRLAAEEVSTQTFNEQESAIRRAEILRWRTPLSIVRVLVLGGADFVGPLLAYLGCPSVHVLDRDERALADTASGSDRAQLCLALHHHDLESGLPAYLAGRFDVVVADAPVTEESVVTISRAARSALMPSHGLLLMLTVTPASLGLEGLRGVQMALASQQFVLTEQLRGALETRVPAAPHGEPGSRSPSIEQSVAHSDVWLCRLSD